MFEIYAVHCVSTRDKQMYYHVGHERVEAWY